MMHSTLVYESEYDSDSVNMLFIGTNDVQLPASVMRAAAPEYALVKRHYST